MEWIANESYKRDNKRKATEKKRKKTHNLLNNNARILKEKEVCLDKLRYRKFELNRVRGRDAKVRNNRMFKEDEGRFYRSINSKYNKKCVVPGIERFAAFWAGIWEDKIKTPHKRSMSIVLERITTKMQQVEDLVIAERILCETIRKKRTGLFLKWMEYKLFGGKSLGGHRNRYLNV